MKRVLLDQGLSPLTAELLRQEGWDAVHVREIGLAQATDPQILERSRNENRVCVTFDMDFHAHLALTSATAPSVVLLRFEGLKGAGLKDLLVAVWERVEDELTAGAAVTVSKHAIRVRRLPMP